MRRLATLIMAVALAQAPSGAAAEEVVRSMTVSGQATVQAVPDQARISLGVVSVAKTARAALADNAKSMQGLVSTLAKAGVEERHIQTSRLSLNPDYSRRNAQSQDAPQIVGYIAQTQVTVLVMDIAALGGVLDDLTRAGANQFNGISFSVSDPEPLLDEARRQAVTKARDKAKLYAQAAGVTLGPLLRLSEAGGGAPGPQPFARAEMLAADMPVAAGEVGISAQVTLEYALE